MAIPNLIGLIALLPWATGWDKLMGFGTLLCVLELARRTSNWL